MAEIVTEARATNSVVRGQGFPALESGNTSFPAGRYRVFFEASADGCSFRVRHRIEGAPLIDSAVAEGLARFVCTVASPVSSYRVSHVATSDEHMVAWEDGDLGEPPMFTPMVVVATPFDRVLDRERDGVHELWHGRHVSFETGVRLALGDVVPMRVLATGWMRSRRGVYAEFDESAYARLRRSLISKSARGSDVQRRFLEAVRDASAFLAYLHDRVPIVQGDELDPLADRMSEAEFGNPPSDTEWRLFEGWRELTPRVACRPAFWARVTQRHIEDDRIESSFLAANRGGTVSGLQRIDAALSASGAGAAKMLDGCVRTVLRRLGGLPEARGNRSVYVNCPLARAWWRERLVAEVANGEGEGVKREIRAVVHSESQQHWEYLVTLVVSRNSVFGSVTVRSILIRAVARKLAEEPRCGVRTAEGLKRVWPDGQRHTGVAGTERDAGG